LEKKRRKKRGDANPNLCRACRRGGEKSDHGEKKRKKKRKGENVFANDLSW